MLAVYAIFNNLIFSLLLLDIVERSPTLYLVLRSVIEARVRLAITAAFLFVVVYIYSFIIWRYLHQDFKYACAAPLKKRKRVLALSARTLNATVQCRSL